VIDNKTIKIATIGMIILLAGCTGEEINSGTGITLKNELSTELMQPGGSVLLRTSINNFFDRELINAQAKLTRSFGELEANPSDTAFVGTVQANPNATARTQWTLDVSETASSGTEFTNKIRLCFNYNQTSWHEIVLVNSFETESEVNSGEDSGPLKISFAGIDTPFPYNEQIKSQIPITVSIKNDYTGFVGRLGLSRDEIPNITYIEMRFYDKDGGPGLGYVSNGSPFGANLKEGTNFEIIKQFTNPSCDKKTSGCMNCDNSLWDETNGYFKCYAQNISVFGDETFIGTKLNVTKLDVEELIEKVEVLISYDYCIESEDFMITVFTPGGR
jgi:hypothetical protein